MPSAHTIAIVNAPARSSSRGVGDHALDAGLRRRGAQQVQRGVALRAPPAEAARLPADDAVLHELRDDHLVHRVAEVLRPGAHGVLAGLAENALHDVLGGGPGVAERVGVERVHPPIGDAHAARDHQLRELGSDESAAQQVRAAAGTAAELVVHEQQESTCHRFSAHR
jgi:hypothetical protein